MATVGIHPITFSSSIAKWSDGYVWHFKEGSGQTYLRGAPLSLSSGLLIITADVTTPAIAGIALVAATGTASTDTEVLLPLSDTIWNVSVDATFTSGQAAPATGKPSDFTIGTTYDMNLDSTSGNYCMVATSSNPVFELLGYPPDQASVVQGRVWVRILTSQTIYT